MGRKPGKPIPTKTANWGLSEGSKSTRFQDGHTTRLSHGVYAFLDSPALGPLPAGLPESIRADVDERRCKLAGALTSLPQCGFPGSVLAVEGLLRCYVVLCLLDAHAGENSIVKGNGAPAGWSRIYIQFQREMRGWLECLGLTPAAFSKMAEGYQAPIWESWRERAAPQGGESGERAADDLSPFITGASPDAPGEGGPDE